MVLPAAQLPRSSFYDFLFYFSYLFKCEKKWLFASCSFACSRMPSDRAEAIGYGGLVSVFPTPGSGHKIRAVLDRISTGSRTRVPGSRLNGGNPPLVSPMGLVWHQSPPSIPVSGSSTPYPGRSPCAVGRQKSPPAKKGRFFAGSIDSSWVLERQLARISTQVTQETTSTKNAPRDRPSCRDPVLCPGPS